MNLTVGIVPGALVSSKEFPNSTVRHNHDLYYFYEPYYSTGMFPEVSMDANIILKKWLKVGGKLGYYTLWGDLIDPKTHRTIGKKEFSDFSLAGQVRFTFYEKPPFIVSKAVIPGMKAKGHGKIINICSMMSELGRETVSAYAAAKGGLKMLTRNICSEFGEDNIQCNGIGPGYIATPQTAPLRERQPDGSRHPFDSFIVAKTPAARWGTPEDLMGPVVFLASDASNFVNGHILYVDGGILAYIGKQP